ncbi:serine/threonine-protein kinase HipA [Agreia bicolorata]|uniref:Serine/threonine-protein kinase HipA n=1 Tax=Agreia bicolorata TaxID=110935 RepID=A0A1T4YKX9_9MICO|nr:HipA domain-containing protein [Agreia bicolorata]SKB02449.1 serine/threonine-protein kinase HipA [Agreia bicolorata]
MVEQTLDVLLHGRRIGTAARSSARAPHHVTLAWNDDLVAGPVRLSESFALLPGTSPPTKLASNFLGGYAPEGNQRQALADDRGIAKDDLFGLLREFGGSMAGALIFQAPDEDPKYSPKYDELTETQLGRLLRKAVTESDLGTQDDSRSMIQGFQPKVLLAQLDGKTWLQPHGRAHSTHILKPQLSTKPSKLYDEFYSHQLARHMGLSSFDSAIHNAGPLKYLAIERFDRTIDNGTVSLLHQEDASQALGIDWVDADSKFQSRERPTDRARPSLGRIAELYATLSDPAALHTWIRQLTYRVLVGDNDGHAKNYGILHLDGVDTVTDVYDAVPNLYQEGRIEWNMAFSIDGQFDHRRMSLDRLVAEVDGWGTIARSDAEKLVMGTVRQFIAALEAIPAPAEASKGMRAALEWNTERLIDGKEISERRS